jgi:hypothetical protein
MWRTGAITCICKSGSRALHPWAELWWPRDDQSPVGLPSPGLIIACIFSGVLTLGDVERKHHEIAFILCKVCAHQVGSIDSKYPKLDKQTVALAKEELSITKDSIVFVSQHQTLPDHWIAHDSHSHAHHNHHQAEQHHRDRRPEPSEGKRVREVVKQVRSGGIETAICARRCRGPRRRKSYSVHG